jgi:hypothetical protein
MNKAMRQVSVVKAGVWKFAKARDWTRFTLTKDLGAKLRKRTTRTQQLFD